MTTAFYFDSTFGQPLVVDGHINGESSGHTLLRRLVGLVEEPAILVPTASERGSGEGMVTTVTLDQLTHYDAVISFNPRKTLELYEKGGGARWLKPQLANFVWFNLSEESDSLKRQMQALSFAKFPTFCNSKRTAAEVIHDLRTTVTPAMADQRPSFRWAPLGIDPVLVDTDQPQGYVEVPKVWYPSTWMFARKQPTLWMDVMAKVQPHVLLEAVMRLHRAALPQVPDAFDRMPWLTIQPMIPDRVWYRRELQTYTAFLATAEDESYGLAYLEALSAGVIGVFLDRPWVREILPPDYPLIVSKQDLVGTMISVLRNVEATRQWIWPDILHWINDEHSEARFDAEFSHWAGQLIGA